MLAQELRDDEAWRNCRCNHCLVKAIWDERKNCKTLYRGKRQYRCEIRNTDWRLKINDSPSNDKIDICVEPKSKD